MRRTSGEHAITAAVGAGFWPDVAVRPGEAAKVDNLRVVWMDHPDGRLLRFTVGVGDGWQHGDLVKVEGSGDWAPDVTDRVARTLPELRAMFVAHEPDREQVYDGSDGIPQVRELDGRERDILCRILQDVQRCLSDPARRERLQPLICLDEPEWPRLAEMAAVLDPRDD